MTNFAKKLWNDESGQGLAEYALLLGLIVVGVVVMPPGRGFGPAVTPNQLAQTERRDDDSGRA